MNAKPKDAIERLRKWLATGATYEPWIGIPDTPETDTRSLLAYLDAIPDGAVPVVWPAPLTRERLEELASKIDVRLEVPERGQPNAWECWPGQANALRALAAIAPQKKKRVVNLWERHDGTERVWAEERLEPSFCRYEWRKVNSSPVEIDE